MGIVYEADHLDLDRRVALKVMVGNVDNNEDAVARFLREARAAARLNSPHVAKVLDVGRLEQGAPFLVMELLEGQNLQSLIKQRGPLSVNEAVDYLLEACEALAEAHDAGVIHRDIKPANLFVANDAYGGKIIKLLDFGVSKIHYGNAATDPRLTDTHSMMGSPAYMSPEQMRSARDVDCRSDIWSLGVVLFEMITGRLPWPGATVGDVLVQVASEPAPTIRSLVKTAPTALDALVARCLEKNPAGRYQSVTDLALALFPLGSDRARATLQRVLLISGQDNAQAVATTVGSRPTAQAAEPAQHSHPPLPVPSKQKTLLYRSPELAAADAPKVIVADNKPKLEMVLRRRRGVVEGPPFLGVIPDTSEPRADAAHARLFPKRAAIGILLGVSLLVATWFVLKHRPLVTESTPAVSLDMRADITKRLPSVQTSSPTRVPPSDLAERNVTGSQSATSVVSASSEPPRDTTIPRVQHQRSGARSFPASATHEQPSLEHQTNSQATSKPIQTSDDTAQALDPMSVRR